MGMALSTMATKTIIKKGMAKKPPIRIVLEKKIRIKLRKWIKAGKRSLLLVMMKKKKMIQNPKMERRIGKIEVEAEIATKSGRDRVHALKSRSEIAARKNQKKRTWKRARIKTKIVRSEAEAAIKIAKGAEREVAHVAVVAVVVDQPEIDVDRQETTAEVDVKSIHDHDRAAVVAVIVEIDAVVIVVTDHARDHASNHQN